MRLPDPQTAHLRPANPAGRTHALAAFTLVEVLTVIALLGILAAILIPTAGSAKNAALRAKTRAQFSQWATGFEQFRQEYGYYPQLYTSATQKFVNTGATATPSGNHLFHDLLAGVRRDGQSLTGATTGNPTPALGQNPRRIRFVSFTDADFILPADVTAGRAVSNQQYFIRDAFFNTSIAVVTDSNLDGVINGRDSSGGFPAATVAGSTTTIRPTTVLTTGTTGGTHAGVVFYCAPPGATNELELIMSWR